VKEVQRYQQFWWKKHWNSKKTGTDWILYTVPPETDKDRQTDRQIDRQTDNRQTKQNRWLFYVSSVAIQRRLSPRCWVSQWHCWVLSWKTTGLVPAQPAMIWHNSCVVGGWLTVEFDQSQITRHGWSSLVMKSKRM